MKRNILTIIAQTEVKAGTVVHKEIVTIIREATTKPLNVNSLLVKASHTRGKEHEVSEEIKQLSIVHPGSRTA